LTAAAKSFLRRAVGNRIPSGVSVARLAMEDMTDPQRQQPLPGRSPLE